MKKVINSAKNKSTNVAPCEVWFGRKSSFTGPTGAEMTAESPKVFGLNIQALAKEAEKMIDVSIRAAENAVEKRLKNEPPPPKIPSGSCIYSKREPTAEAKSKNEKWIGPLRCIESNDRVELVEDKNASRDLVHREHVCHAKERNVDLKWIEQFEDMYIFPHLTETALQQ